LIKHTFDELKISLNNTATMPEQELKLCALIEKFGDIFAVNNSELTGTDRLKFKINIQQDARRGLLGRGRILISRRREWRSRDKFRRSWP